jgi:hypothetical protein
LRNGVPTIGAKQQEVPRVLDLGMLVLKGLAVVGGAAVGGLGSGLLFRLLVRFVIHRPASPTALRLIRTLGAVALGLAVWLWVSSSGGLGPGGGGWFGTGAGTRQAPLAKSEPAPSADTTPTPDTAPLPLRPPDSQSRSAHDTLRIEILGGARVQQGRFYLLEGNKEPLTLDEVRKAIQTRQQEKDKPPLKGIVILIYGSSVARDHPAVRNLAKWAEQNHLSVTFPPTNGAAP